MDIYFKSEYKNKYRTLKIRFDNSEIVDILKYLNQLSDYNISQKTSICIKNIWLKHMVKFTKADTGTIDIIVYMYDNVINILEFKDYKISEVACDVSNDKLDLKF